MGKLSDIIEEIRRGIVEIIYPRDCNCIICHKEDIEGICNECKNNITYCKDNTIDNISIGYYSGILKDLILKLKCKNNFEAGDILVSLAEDRLKEIDSDYYLTYIPISKKSFKERGFNQCEYIAKELGYRNKYLVIDTLKRVKEGKVQKLLSKEERLENLKGAFEVIDKSRVEGKKIILIDDVVTTGATILEAKRVLMENGIKEIKILTLAKSHI